MAKIVMSYNEGCALQGTASEDLVRRSAAEETGTGTVSAYRDSDGVWQYVAPSDVAHYRRHLHVEVVTVYVLETRPE